MEGGNAGQRPGQSGIAKRNMSFGQIDLFVSVAEVQTTGSGSIALGPFWSSRELDSDGAMILAVLPSSSIMSSSPSWEVLLAL